MEKRRNAGRGAKPDLARANDGPPPARAFPPLQALRAFDAVARLGGVRRAAEALGVDHSSISRHLRTLEAWTGAPLVSKTGRSVQLTDEGLRYHQRLAPSLDELAQATLGLMERYREPQLSVRCAPAFANNWLIPRLSSFKAAHPGVSLEVTADTGLAEFPRHEAQVGIYDASGEGLMELPPNLQFVDVARPRVFAVASADYLRRSPRIETLTDMMGHTLLIDRTVEHWRRFFSAYGIGLNKDVRGPRYANGALALDAARLGHGIALANAFAVYDDLAAGRLVDVTIGGRPLKPQLFDRYVLVVRSDHWSLPVVSQFRTWLTEAVRRETLS